MTDDVRKLLGGYATGTLSEEEQRALFQAALEDPEIFAALAEEQPLKDLMDDPAARAELLEAASAPVRKKRSMWAWLVPAGALAAAVTVAVIGLQVFQQKPAPPVTTAQVHTAPPAAPAPAAAVKMKDAPSPKPAAIVEPRAEKAVTKPAAKEAAPPEAAVAAPPPVSDNVAVPSPQPEAPMQAARSVRMAEQNEPMMLAKQKASVFMSAPQYTLLKQSGTGEFVVVPQDTVLSKNDVIRVRVRAGSPGQITLLQGTTLVSVENAVSAGDYVLPGEGGIKVSAGSTLELRIAKPIAPVAQAFAPGARAISDKAESSTRVLIQLKTE